MGYGLGIPSSASFHPFPHGMEVFGPGRQYLALYLDGDGGCNNLLSAKGKKSTQCLWLSNKAVISNQSSQEAPFCGSLPKMEGVHVLQPRKST